MAAGWSGLTSKNEVHFGGLIFACYTRRVSKVQAETCSSLGSDRISTHKLS